jgi:hypothetical protein
MKNEYLEQLYEDLQDDHELTRTEIQMTYGYNQMKEYGYDTVVLDSLSGLDSQEIYDIMFASGFEELYITGEWSNQFDNWFNLQQAGFEMLGVREIDNPRYIRDIKKYKESWDKAKMYVLVFKMYK